jgi:uncharacterized OB-fold protein
VSEGAGAPQRPLPVLTPDNRAFFTAGHQGKLMIHRCQDCGYYLHPPTPRCGACLSARVEPTAVSGRGDVYSFTVNEYPWHPAFEPPYAVALVSLEEQPLVRLTTNIIGCDPYDVRVGMRVQVEFLDCGEVALPVFRPYVGEDDDV